LSHCSGESDKHCLGLLKTAVSLWETLVPQFCVYLNLCFVTAATYVILVLCSCVRSSLQRSSRKSSPIVGTFVTLQRPKEGRRRILLEL